MEVFGRYASSRLTAEQSVVLTDYSVGMLTICIKAIEGMQIPVLNNFIVNDVEKLPFFTNQFDTIQAHLVLYHVGSIDNALNEIKRVLAPNG